MPRGKKGRKGKKREGSGLSENANADFLGGEVTLGWEKAGIGAAITFSGDNIIISLGIGVAAVELDLGELNNSTVSYAFDLYEIEGYRDGCTVTLEYRIAGVTVRTEVRKIPDCEDEKEQEPKEENEDFAEIGTGENDSPIDIPGSPLDIGVFLVGLTQNRYQAGIGREYMNAHFEREKHEKTDGNIFFLSGARIYWKYTNKSKGVRNWWYRPSSVHPEWLVDTSQEEDYEYSHESESIRRHNDGYFIGKILYHSFSPGYIGNGFVYVGRAGKIKEVINLYLPNYYSNNLIPVEDVFGNRTPAAPINLMGTWSYSKFQILDSKILEKVPTRKSVNGKQSQKTRKKRNDKMDEKCCRMIAQIYDVLAVDEMIDEGFNIPKKWYAPNAEGMKKLDNYMQVQDYQMRMLDHYGISPFTAEIADANLLKKGKQKLELQTINGTDAVKQILQNTLKNDTSNKTSLRILGALSISLGQILKMLSHGVRLIQEIQQFLGMPVFEQEFSVKMPFNFQALLKKKSTKGKGFKPGQPEPEPELNVSEDLETLLPKFIQNGEQSYTCEVYNDDYPNLIEQLTNNQFNNDTNS